MRPSLKAFGNKKIYNFSVSAVRFVFLFAMVFIIIYPLIYMVSVSLREVGDMNDPLVVWIPRNVTFENIKEVFSMMNYPTAFFNSLMLCGVSALLSVFSCGIVGYGFARFDFPLKKMWFIGVVLTILVPTQTVLIPMITTMRYFDFFGIGQLGALFTGKEWSVNLIGTPFSMYVPALFASGIRAGLFIFIYRQFFLGLPNELEEAAYLDGCGPVKTFLKVMLPLAKGSVLVVMLLSAVVYWNDDFYTSYFFDNLTTMRAAVTGIGGRIEELISTGNKGMYMEVYKHVAALLFILPPLVLYIVFQRQFTESIERTGVVG